MVAVVDCGKFTLLVSVVHLKYACRVYNSNNVYNSLQRGRHAFEAFAMCEKMLVFASYSDVSLRPGNYAFPLLFKVCAKLLLSLLGHAIIAVIYMCVTLFISLPLVRR